MVSWVRGGGEGGVRGIICVTEKSIPLCRRFSEHLPISRCLQSSIKYNEDTTRYFDTFSLGLLHAAQGPRRLGRNGDRKGADLGSRSD